MNDPDFAAWFASPVGMAAAVATAFAAGSMVGSFLNVVAHRVPRGETVVHGRSHCPACGATIRPWDNVPVLGWLLLRGRCRDCGAAISARYPLVEAACGGLAAALAAAELWAAPGDVPEAIAVAWAGRTALAMAIVAWALLAERGHDVAASSAATVAAVAALSAALEPTLRPLPAWCGPALLSTDAWPGCLLASAAGLLAGWVAGAIGGRPARLACASVGAALGWQAAVVAAVAAGAVRATVRHPAAACLAATAAILAWHPLCRAWAAACGSSAGA
ncbi:MAG: prepilin peptidase [Planctomycetaceae bacterium]